MKTKNIYKTKVSQLKALSNLFIEMTAKNCNQKCKRCYIDFPISKNIKDFIPIDLIKTCLSDTKNEKIEFIYLTGAEPMTHPDFNAILRLCLKRTNVCICTNATFINEKKARFLKKVEEESNFEIIFSLPLAHFEEIKNDDIRSRGSYRSVIHATRILCGYNFNIILNVMNYYNLSKELLTSELLCILNNMEIPSQKIEIRINEYYNPLDIQDNIGVNAKSLDCETGRVLSVNGVYACPFLTNDYRGRMGSTFKDYNDKIYLETPFCQICAKNQTKIFSIT